MAGTQDGFFTIINKNLSGIEYSTFIGGDSTDQVNSVFVENADHCILAGQTKSPDFTITADALNKKYLGGKSDGFIMKFNLKTNKPEYSSFIGGSRTDLMNYVSKTENQKYVLVGTSSSRDFPVTKDALFSAISGGMDLVILTLDNTLRKLEYATYGGGSKQIVVDPDARYINGGVLQISSLCVSPDFPATFRYAEPDSTWTNCIWKLNLKQK